MSHVLHADVDIARTANVPLSVVIRPSGCVRLSVATMAALHFARVVFWRYLGNDGFNVIEADDWESTEHTVLTVYPPRPERGEPYFRLTIPKHYRVGVIPGDYSSRATTCIHEGRGVLSVPGAIDKARLHQVW